MDRSWLLPGAPGRRLALALMAAVVVGFIGSALAWRGVPELAGSWAVVTIATASAPLALPVPLGQQMWTGVRITSC